MFLEFFKSSIAGYGSCGKFSQKNVITERPLPDELFEMWF